MSNRVTKQKRFNNAMLYRMDSEIPPVEQIRLKIEINCYEHFNELGLVTFPFSVSNRWFNGSCDITTYHFAELLGTKLRALYQRRKGRDLFDLYVALKRTTIDDDDDIIRCYRRYISFSTPHPPTRKQFLMNMEEKMRDSDFLTDSAPILRPGIAYDPFEAYDLVRERLLSRL